MREDLFVKRDESDPKALEMREAIVKDAQRTKENSIPPITGIGRTSLRSFHPYMPDERIPSTVYGLRGSGMQEDYVRNESVAAGLHWDEYDVRRQVSSLQDNTPTRRERSRVVVPDLDSSPFQFVHNTRLASQVLGLQKEASPCNERSSLPFVRGNSRLCDTGF